MNRRIMLESTPLVEEDAEEAEYLARLAEVRRDLQAARKPKTLKVDIDTSARVRIPRRSLIALHPSPTDEPSRKTGLGRHITACEELAMELLGIGAAVSLDAAVFLDERKVGWWMASVWDAKGAEVFVCPPQSTRTKAISFLKKLLVAEERKRR